MLTDSLTQFSQLATEAIDELWNLLSDALAACTAEHAKSPCEPAVQALPRTLELIQQIEAAAAQSGLTGLQLICAMVMVNLQTIQTNHSMLSAAQLQLLAEWPELLMGMVITQGEENAIDLLLKNMAAAGWPLAMSEDDIRVAKEMFVDIENEHLAAPAQEMQQPTLENIPEILLESNPKKPHADLQQVESDMLKMLSKEFMQMIPQMREDLALASNKQYSDDERQSALDNYTDLLGRVSLVSESVGLLALSQLMRRFKKMMSETRIAVSPAQQMQLEKLPELISAYFTDPQDKNYSAALVSLLAAEIWHAPITAANTPLWINALSNVLEIDNSEQKLARQTEATFEDVTLALPDDINPELLDGLLQELPIQTSAFTAAILRMSTGLGNTNDINRAMRAAHTLKGAANTVGIRGIANLTHHLEDILMALADENRIPDPALAAMLVNAGDCLEAMSEALLGVGPAPEQAQEVMQSVLDYANRIDREGVATVATLQIAALTQDFPLIEETNKHNSHNESNLSIPGQGLRVAAPVVDELLRLAGETLISNSQIQDGLRRTVKQAAAIQQQQKLLTQLVAELESLVDIRGIAAPEQLKPNQSDFDPLEFESFSELHTVTRRLIEATSDSQQLLNQVTAQFTTLGDLLDVQQRLQMENQHAVIGTRLVPVSGVESRLQRSVRQTCRLLDKQVTLDITGGATHIDSNVLSDLMDPLMHILRNAIDHGIDEPATRIAAGKAATGKIELSFAREGNTIVVRCQDDGVGLDYASIQRIAERKGMIPPERKPTQEELARMILLHGFSTRDETTQVSGRGIGMDVVYSSVLQMKGTLALKSNSGKGLLVELRLPITLLSTHSLIVRHGEKLLAISSRGVEDIHYVTQEQIERIETQPFYRIGDAVHNLVKLETLLALPGDRRETGRLGFPVLLTRMENGALCAVLVQEVMDGREVVVKNFGRYVPKIHGSIGATILGDGSVAPVIDLVELLRTPVPPLLSQQSTSNAAGENHGNQATDLRTALIVDDSLTARRTAAKIMQDAGYAVRTAIDGLEAIAMLQNHIPDIMLVDMEMPRMNGLELTTHIRNHERTKQIPVIMITSRSTEKHRRQAMAAGADVYLVKPFNEDVLLDHLTQLRRGDQHAE